MAPRKISASDLIGVGEWYMADRKIGSGNSGVVFSGVDLRTCDAVAFKVVLRKESGRMISYESRVLALIQGGHCIPRLRWFGVEKGYNVIVMDRLGKNLEELFLSCSNRFTMKTVLMLADHILEGIEFIHSRNVVHRSIKPDNLMMGFECDSLKVFLIDFGRAKEFIDSINGEHVPYRKNRTIRLSPFSSINGHKGIESSRRDDLESLAYVLIYFIKGSLPWQGIPASNKRERNEKIIEMKVSTPIEVLCSGLPEEFALYLRYCRKLKFKETPDYNYLRELFRALYLASNYKNDFIYDWRLREGKDDETNDANCFRSRNASYTCEDIDVDDDDDDDNITN